MEPPQVPGCIRWFYSGQTDNNFLSQNQVPPLIMCESDEQGIIRLKPIFDAKQEQINEKLIKELEHNYVRQIIVKPIIKQTKEPMTRDHINYRQIMIEQIASKFKNLAKPTKVVTFSPQVEIITRHQNMVCGRPGVLTMPLAEYKI